MTATLIPSTSSAPTLRDTATQAFLEAEAASEAQERERMRAEIARTEELLRILLRDKLGVTDAEILSHELDGERAKLDVALATRGDE